LPVPPAMYTRCVQQQPDGLEVWVGAPAEGFTPGGGAVAQVHPLLEGDFPWPDVVRVRRNGEDTSRCVACLCPYPGPELYRFLQGACLRDETALGILQMYGGATFNRPDRPGTLNGVALPRGTHLDLAEDLDPVDQDFGLRVRNGLSPDIQLYALSADHPRDGRGRPDSSHRSRA